jgi:mono/diheme cytochrome c family protein
VLADPPPLYEQDILPILTSRCALSGCHVAGGPHGVDLRTYDTLQKGGEHGTIIVAGNADESELVEQIVEGKMPLGGPRLKTSQIQLIIDWVNSGANDD